VNLENILGKGKDGLFTFTQDFAAIQENKLIKTDFNKLSRNFLTSSKKSEGKFMEGILFTDPYISLGIMTFLMDKQGNNVQQHIAKRLKHQQDVVESKFERGAVLRIAEPFYKIFQDGSRGIQVDSSKELHFFPDSFDGESNNVFDLDAIREKEKKFFK